jgi:hypothetical protein
MAVLIILPWFIAKTTFWASPSPAESIIIHHRRDRRTSWDHRPDLLGHAGFFAIGAYHGHV